MKTALLKLVSLSLAKWPVIFLILLEISLFITNYISGTYLVGWDNVYPELNFKVNLERNIFAIWQEYRGLGVIDGMAHAANLPHTLFMFILSFILPQSILRYLFTFLMHFLGGLGMYLLLKKLTKQEGLLPLFGAFFYQFNLATIQMFFAPLEVFSTHFAFLPLLIFLILKYLDKGGKKLLVLFFLFTFLSTPQAHVPSVFLVSFFATLVIVIFSLISKRNIPTIKRSVVIMLLITLVNSFWGLPYIYATIHASSTIINSKINIMSTDNIVLRNKAFGDLVSVALLRGFSLDYVDFQPEGKNNYMMNSWRSHINKPVVFIISIIFFLLAVFGVLKAVIKRKVIYYPFVSLFIFSFLILGSDIPILSIFSETLKRFVPLFYDVFRFTFTKFSILYALSYTILLVYGLKGLLGIWQNKKFYLAILALSILSLFIYGSPSFKGEFLYKNLRINIPHSYLKLIAYFKNQQQNTRITMLPQPSYWNWTYTNWGFRGSGFIWYGLPQASLDGAFYPWSKENENYYWELSQAIYSSNKKDFENVFDKYQIQWLIIDKNIISPFSSKAVYVDKLENVIKKSTKFTETASFDNIKVYKTKLSNYNDKSVFVTKNLPKIAPLYNFNNNDKAYNDYKNYIAIGNQNSSVDSDTYYPFRSLFTARIPEKLDFNIEDKGSYFSFTTKIPKDLIGGKLFIPSLIKEEITEIDAKNLHSSKELYPLIFLDEELITSTSSQTEQPLTYLKKGFLEVRIPKILGLYSANKTEEIMNLKSKNCEFIDRGIYNNEKVKENKKQLLRFISINATNCADLDLSNLTQRISYLIAIESRNIEGKSLLFAVSNKMSQRTDMETYLPKSKKITTSYFIIPPMEQYGLGYSIHLSNESIGRIKSINDLGKITVNPIPYQFLTSIKIVKKQVKETKTFSNVFVKHPNPSYYKITLNDDEMNQLNNSTLVLSQSFDPGWKAYQIKNYESGIMNYAAQTLPFLFGKELKEHVLVNNWSNGWTIQNQISKIKDQNQNLNLKTGTNKNPQTIEQLSNSTIVIFFWPQYLEYLGFILLFGTFIYMFRYKEKAI